MRKSLIISFIGLAALSGCLSTDKERALAGAAAGALTADAFNGNVLTGAALGGLAGAMCDDANLCN